MVRSRIMTLSKRYRSVSIGLKKSKKKKRICIFNLLQCTEDGVIRGHSPKIVKYVVKLGWRRVFLDFLQLSQALIIHVVAIIWWI